MGIIKEIIHFFSDSPKRMRVLRSEITDCQEEYTCLTNKKRWFSLCVTQWIDKTHRLKLFLGLCIPIVKTVDKFRRGNEKSNQPNNCSTSQIVFNILFQPPFSCFLLSDVVPISSLLQTESLDFSLA